MLDTAMKTQLKAYLERVVRPIEIKAFVDDGPRAREMLELIADIAAQSDKIAVTEVRAAGERVPSFALTSPGESIELRFAGLPMGHEFTSLVLALLQVGGYPPKIEQALADQIRAIDGDFHFETYFSQSCQNCPDVVQALNLMAVLNPRVHHVAVDGAAFQGEVETRQVMSVPTVYLNGALFGQGRMTTEEIVAKLDSGAARREAARLDGLAPYDVLVVGGGPAGAAAAIYAARKGVRTGVAAARFGGQILDTMEIANFISVPHTEGPRLATALESHVRAYDVDILNLQTARRLVPGDDHIAIELDSGATLKSRSVILARQPRIGWPTVPSRASTGRPGTCRAPS